MASTPGNPDYKNHKTSGTDNSISLSVTGGGNAFINGQTPVVTSNSHPVATRADGALYDTTSGAYVAIQLTNIGTTAIPKNGQ